VQINALGTLNIFDLTFSRFGVLSAEKSVSWVDPLVFARLRHRFAPGLNFFVSGDVGGFDVGSKFSWQVLAALDYEFCRSRTVTWSAMLGYKALSVDYSQGSGLTHYEFDMTMQRADIRCYRAVLRLNELLQCPLWVISGHVQCKRAWPLCPRKRHQMRHMESPLRANRGIESIMTVQESNAATRGKVTLISVNSPGCVSTSMEPPCCFTMMS
jgi:hypothetical protein